MTEFEKRVCIILSKTDTTWKKGRRWHDLADNPRKTLMFLCKTICFHIYLSTKGNFFKKVKKGNTLYVILIFYPSFI
jgi:hypothetical protein